MNFVMLTALSALSAGPRLEPLFHPKPGAVTRMSPHSDKDVIDFCINSLLIEISMLKAFTSASSEEDPVAIGLEEYLHLLRRLNIRRNIALGSAMLHIPLAASLGTFSLPPPVEKLVSRASALALRSRGGGRAYYKLLEYLKPTHLRRYRGPIPAVGEGSPDDLAKVLRSADWDYVHSELLNGYKMSLKALRVLEESARDPLRIEDPALHALLTLLSEHGDTLIMNKYGIRSLQRALEEARSALFISTKVGVRGALNWLDSLWRPRGWNPGAILDILSTAISLYYYEVIRKKVLGLGYNS